MSKGNNSKTMKAKMISAVMAGTLVMTACGDSSSTGYSQTFDPKHLVDYILIGSDFSTLNYLTTYIANDLRVTNNLVSGLLRTDNYGETVGQLAESWEHNEDNSIWTFKLREGVQWVTRDGTPYAEITADDFVYGIEYILDPENVSMNTEMVFLLEGAQEYYEAKERGENPDFSTVGVKAIDKYTVQYTMADGGKPYFESASMYSAFKPANRQYIESLPDSNGIPGPRTYGTTPDLLLYCGPYILTEYEADSSKTLTKNQAYWNPDEVTFDDVTILAIKDSETALEYFERGELSYAPLSTTQYTAEAEKGNEYLVQTSLSTSSYGLLMNNSSTISDDANAAINNENFRKSLYYGLDSDEYNVLTVPTNVEEVRSYAFTARGFLYTSDGRDYTTLGELGKWQTYPYNAETANEYKQKAIEELTAQGVSFPIELTYAIKSGNELESQQITTLKSLLEETLGTDYVTINITEYSNSWYTDVRDKGAWNLWIRGWGPDYKDPINVLNTMTTTSGQINDISSPTTAVTHFDIPEFDALVAEANAETVDLDRRYELFANAEAYLIEHAYFIPMYITGGTYEVTSINRYSKIYNNTTTYIGWEAKDHAITAEEMEGYRQEWLEKRRELGYQDE